MLWASNNKIQQDKTTYPLRKVRIPVVGVFRVYSYNERLLISYCVNLVTAKLESIECEVIQTSWKSMGWQKLELPSRPQHNDK